MARIRWAVVGLGYIAQVAVLPAFKNADNAELAALVSDDAKKLKKLGSKYGVSLRLPYSEYETLLASGQVDAVYIALPNNLHRDFTVAAARHGVHVLCEKPMAVTEEDCQAMIDAARSGGIRAFADVARPVRARDRLLLRLHRERARSGAFRRRGARGRSNHPGPLSVRGDGSARAASAAAAGHPASDAGAGDAALAHPRARARQREGTVRLSHD